MTLPAAVATALEARLEGVRRDGLAASAERFSAAYRAGQSSAGVVRTDADALAYALVRMPATFAAVRFALQEAQRLAPDMAPTSLVDVGAGTGAATLAASEIWPSLRSATLIEPNASLSVLAVSLLSHSHMPVTLHAADARTFTTDDVKDLAIAAYLLVELGEQDAVSAVRNLLTRSAGTVALIEPGTTAGFARIRAARQAITAAGWHILAPCPQAGQCPLPANDWCHFRVRLARSRTHKMLKGADVPFEDEPLSYVVATKAPPARARGRILRPPQVDKGQVRLTVCAETGVTTHEVPRRNKHAYKAARASAAGDAWE